MVQQNYFSADHSTIFVLTSVTVMLLKKILKSLLMVAAEWRARHLAAAGDTRALVHDCVDSETQLRL